jgi:8-oxo-dGTP diphosphatase
MLGRTGERVRIEQAVGSRVRERRDALGLSQAQLGERLGDLLGRPWPRQAVSSAEKGERSFGVAELVAFAAALDTTVNDLIKPPGSEESVALGGAALPLRALRAVLTTTGREREDLNLPAIEQTLSDLSDAIARGQADLGHALQLARQVDSLIIERLRAGGVASAPWAAGMDPTAEHGEPVKQAQPIVAAIVTSPQGVLITKRRDGKPPWGFVTGEIEPGEQPADAAVREVKEETGLVVLAGQAIGERDHPQTGRHMIYMACAPTNGLEVEVGDEAELEEVRWVSLAEAGRLLPGMYEPVRDYLAGQV